MLLLFDDLYVIPRTYIEIQTNCFAHTRIHSCPLGSKDEEGEAGKNMGELLPGEKLKNNPNRAWEAEESRTRGSIKNN